MNNPDNNVENIKHMAYGSGPAGSSAIGTSGPPMTITATNMVLSTNTCAGSCTITATVTWRNDDTISYTFTPAIILDGTTTIYGDELTILGNGGYGNRIITVANLQIGTHTICPYPN